VEEPASKRADRNFRRPNFVLQSEEFEHWPFASGNCTLCHLAVNTQGVAQETKVSSASLKLAYPKEVLCAGCHAEKAPANAAAAGLWPHGPVAGGWCTSCHNPHKAKRRYMLLAASNAAMCGQCHRPQDLKVTPQHAGTPAPECTECHNPHAGRDKLLLRADYDEQRRYGAT